jgi:hypothetical protein
VRKWLSEKEFVDGAIGNRYIEEPPASLEDVEKNLHLLQEVLKKEDPLSVCTSLSTILHPSPCLCFS